MNCATCRPFLKRVFCIVACKDANADLCKTDNAIKGAHLKKQQWQIDLERETFRQDIKHGVLLFLGVAFIYLLLNISSCGHVGGADTADGAALYQVAHKAATQEVQP